MKVNYGGKEYDVPGCAILGVDERRPEKVYCLKRWQCSHLGECLVAGIATRPNHVMDSARGNEALATGMR